VGNIITFAREKWYFLQHRLNVKLSQRQILTPGLVQMCACSRSTSSNSRHDQRRDGREPGAGRAGRCRTLLDDVGRQEEERDRIAAKATSEEATPIADEKKDPFEEIDLARSSRTIWTPATAGSGEMEEIEKPSLRTLSKPGNLSDHLLWQLGRDLRAASGAPGR